MKTELRIENWELRMDEARCARSFLNSQFSILNSAEPAEVFA